MPKSKQSPKDRAVRLEKGCCPIHGGGMVQVGLVGPEGAQVALVACCRGDCSVQGTAPDPGGAVTLLPEHQHLLN
jgi:hypothetical protein